MPGPKDAKVYVDGRETTVKVTVAKPGRTDPSFNARDLLRDAAERQRESMRPKPPPPPVVGEKEGTE